MVTRRGSLFLAFYRCGQTRGKGGQAQARKDAIICFEGCFGSMLLFGYGYAHTYIHTREYGTLEGRVSKCVELRVNEESV